MKTRKTSLLFAAIAATAIIALSGCPEAVRMAAPPEVPEDFDWLAAWTAVLNEGGGFTAGTGLISARGATLTPTDDGIVVSGRGTGEHDHNNGVHIDVAGLRGTGTPAIVVAGTATAGHIIAVQGVAGNIQATTSPAGTFTVTIPGANAVQVYRGQTPANWVGPVPVLATGGPEQTGGAAHHGEFSVTSILVGGQHIWDAMGLDLD